MYNDDLFMQILDLCGNLDINGIECLIANLEIMIENKKEDEGDDENE